MAVKGVTGYTSAIVDGRVKTGADFLKRCMRQFGACGAFRDEPLDEPLENLIDKYATSKYDFDFNDHYYRDRMKKAIEDLNIFIDLVDDEKQAMFEQEKKEKIEVAKNYFNNMVNERELYLNILNDVKLWEPPGPEYKQVKSFAIQQIEMCMPTETDIHESTMLLNELQYPSYMTKDEEYANWKKNKYNSLTHDVAYYTERAADEGNKTEEDGTILYLRKFLDSLKTIDENKKNMEAVK